MYVRYGSVMVWFGAGSLFVCSRYAFGVVIMYIHALRCVTLELQSWSLTNSATLEYLPIMTEIAGNVRSDGVVTSCSINTLILAICISN